MTSEEIKAIVYYIQGLQALWKEGYNAEKVGDYCHVLKTVYSYFVSLIYVFHFLS